METQGLSFLKISSLPFAHVFWINNTTQPGPHESLHPVRLLQTLEFIGFYSLPYGCLFSFHERPYQKLSEKYSKLCPLGQLCLQFYNLEIITVMFPENV